MMGLEEGGWNEAFGKTIIPHYTGFIAIKNQHTMVSTTG